MKKTVLCFLLLLAPAIAMADDVEVCSEFADSAKMIMELRQQGVDLSEVMKRKAIKDFELGRKIVLLAWGQPLYSTEEYKVRAVMQFKNEVFRQCMVGLEEAKNGRN